MPLLPSWVNGTFGRVPGTLGNEVRLRWGHSVARQQRQQKKVSRIPVAAVGGLGRTPSTQGTPIP